MCGRARCTLRADDIPRACRLNGRPLRSINMDRYRPSYNVSPGRDLPVVRRDDGLDGDGVVLHCMKWGLIPSFTKKNEKPDHYKMFNARSESVHEKASFRRLVPNNRCLVSVEGFYEWKKDGSKKQPYYIHFMDGHPLVFAALYDMWKNSEGEVLYTFTILTTSSSSTLTWLHDRMPVILGDKESMDAWLLGSPSSRFETVLKSYEGPDLVWYPVTSAMGKPSYDGPECIMEIKLKMDAARPISKFFSKKGGEQGSNLDSKHVDRIKTDQPENLAEEPQIQDSLNHPSVSDEGNLETKPNISTLTKEEAGNIPIKRGYEELSTTDAKPAGGKAEKRGTSPLKKKKKNLGAAADKQPTMLSYFGKT